MRLLANGQAIDSHQVTPLGNGSPIDETFTVSPNALNPTVYTAEVAADPGETITENNSAQRAGEPRGPQTARAHDRRSAGIRAQLSGRAH